MSEIRNHDPSDRESEESSNLRPTGKDLPERKMFQTNAADGIEKRVGSEVLTTVAMKSPIFWDITSSNPFIFNLGFGDTCRLHLQD
jgi:hypothetical protein